MNINMNLTYALSVIFLLFFITYEPVAGYFSFRKFIKLQTSGNNMRIKYYKKLLAGIWIPVVIISALAAAGLFSWEALGVKLVALPFKTVNKWFIAGTLILSLILFILTLYQLLAAKFSPAYREKLKAQAAQIPAELSAMLPQTAQEKRYWLFISITAGLTEEFMYRGFLLYILNYLFPAAGIIVCVLASAIIFGLAHSYQGISGIAKTGILGLLFSSIYITTGSILPGMVLHFIIDFAAKDYMQSSENTTAAAG